MKKEFLTENLKNIADCKDFINKKYKINSSNNVVLLAEKVLSIKDLEGEIVECGVFKGSTLLVLAEFCKRFSIDKTIYGYDTFCGFPDEEINDNDKLDKFKFLLDQSKITKDHYDKAKERTNDFTNISHLTNEYFNDVEDIFKLSLDYPSIELVKGEFNKTLPNHKGDISLLYIDCDLYLGYKDVLNNLYNKVVSSGVVVFDEYYSLKYPGARIAVDEFFKDKKGKFEYYITEEGFERWCFIKD